MIYDLKNELDRARFKARVNHLYANSRQVELTEKTPRSLNQNSYLHLLLGLLAIETGESTLYVKEYYYKRLFNPDLFIIHKEDAHLGDVELLRSSSDLTTEEMSLSIDRLRNLASKEMGCYLPAANEHLLLQQAEIEVQRHRRDI